MGMKKEERRQRVSALGFVGRAEEALQGLMASLMAIQF